MFDSLNKEVNKLTLHVPFLKFHPLSCGTIFTVQCHHTEHKPAVVCFFFYGKPGSFTSAVRRRRGLCASQQCSQLIQRQFGQPERYHRQRIHSRVPQEDGKGIVKTLSFTFELIPIFEADSELQFINLFIFRFDKKRIFCHLSKPSLVYSDCL